MNENDVLKGGNKKMRRILIFSTLLVGIFFVAISNGLMYPTADLLENGQVEFSLGSMHIGIGAGIGGNFELGYALSVYDMGTYLKMRPFRNTLIGVSYLPFNFCLFGTCETTRLFNVYGVYKIGNPSFNTNFGLKLLAANGENMVDAFTVIQKKMNSSLLILEGGIEKLSTSPDVKFNVGTGIYEKFNSFSIKGGLMWMNFKLNEESVMHPLPYLEVDLTLDLVKR